MPETIRIVFSFLNRAKGVFPLFLNARPSTKGFASRRVAMTIATTGYPVILPFPFKNGEVGGCGVKSEFDLY